MYLNIVVVVVSVAAAAAAASAVCGPKHLMLWRVLYSVILPSGPAIVLEPWLEYTLPTNNVSLLYPGEDGSTPNAQFWCRCI